MPVPAGSPFTPTVIGLLRGRDASTGGPLRERETGVLRDRLVREGDFLFRHRSYLPLIALPLIAWELARYHYPLGSHGWDLALETLCFAIAGLGLAVRALVQGYAPRGTSGRNSRQQKAASLTTTGAYSVCRNPLYFGNFLITFGVLCFFHSIYLLLAYTLIFWIYYERIILREEEFLFELYGDAYARWAERTPAFLPRLHGWTWPDRPFNWRTVVRREYPTVLFVVLALTAFEVLGDWKIHHQVRISQGSALLLAAAIVQYVVLRQVKKRTRLLRSA